MVNMYVNLTSNPAGDYTGMIGGEMIRLPTTVDDRRLFGMTDDSVKNAITTILGKRPDDVLYNDPTKWGNAYRDFGWPEITLTLKPVSSTCSNVNITNSALATNEVTNNLDKVIRANVAFITQKDNTEETNWSQTSSLSVTQKVEFTIKFFKSETSIGYGQEWQKGGSHAQTISIGSSVAIEVDIDPGQTIRVTNWGEIGLAQVKIIYAASLSGLVLANYSNKHNGHHFWGVSVDSVLSTLKVANRIEVVQNMNMTSYFYTRTTVSYPLKATGEEQVVHVSDQLALPADLPALLPQGVKSVTKE